MSETLILLAAFIAVMALWLAALWLFGCIHGEDAFGEAAVNAKPAPRRVRAGQPVIDLDACERAGMLAAVLDFDDDTTTDNPEIYQSSAFATWATAYEKTMHELRSNAADSMLPAP